MVVAISSNTGKRADPASAAHKFALLWAGGLAVIGEQVKNALQVLRLEE
jgi:hypothetical protein